MSIEIIGLSGKVGSGKSFVRNLLRDRGWFPWGFAWHLKNMALMEPPFSWSDLHFAKPPEVRTFLQQLGTEQGRDKYGEDCWVHATHAWLLTLSSFCQVQRFVIDDVRFPNEARWIKRMGGQVVRLEHGDRPYPLAGTPAAEHASETALDGYVGFDCTIVNGLSTTPMNIIHALEEAHIL